MAEPPNVCLTLSNQPENVLLVRETLSGHGRDGRRRRRSSSTTSARRSPRRATTSCCTPTTARRGRCEVELYVRADAVEVVVRDHGIGHQAAHPHATRRRRWASACRSSRRWRRASSSSDVDGRRHGGAHGVRHAGREGAGLADAQRLSGTERGALAAGHDDRPGARAETTLARKVLPRVMCVLAARAHFTTDRISDAELVADALVVARRSGRARGDHLNVSVTVEPRSLELRVGPAGQRQRPARDRELSGRGPRTGHREADRRSPHRHRGPVGDARAAPARPALSAADAPLRRTRRPRAKK